MANCKVALLMAALVALLALCCTADAQRGAQELSATPRALLRRGGRKACTTDAGCSSEKKCVNDVCTDDTKPEDRHRVGDDRRNGRDQPKTCTTDADCSAEKKCVNNVCTDNTKPEDRPRVDGVPNVEDKPKVEDQQKVDDKPKVAEAAVGADVAAYDGASPSGRH